MRKDPDVIDAEFEIVSGPTPQKAPVDHRWPFFLIRAGLILAAIIATIVGLWGVDSTPVDEVPSVAASAGVASGEKRPLGR